jgi:hypothetical protein
MSSRPPRVTGCSRGSNPAWRSVVLCLYAIDGICLQLLLMQTRLKEGILSAWMYPFLAVLLSSRRRCTSPATTLSLEGILPAAAGTLPE